MSKTKKYREYDRKKAGKWLLTGLALLGAWSAFDRIKKAAEEKKAAELLAQKN